MSRLVDSHGAASFGGASSPEVNSPVVCSWNEWDPLEEIVVGVATGAHFDLKEPGHRPRRRGSRRDLPFPQGAKPAESIDKANAELDGLAALLERRGVTVRRPAPLDLSQPVRTPYFAAEHQYCVTCPRDVLLTVGSEIIEATMSRRARYFEHLAYRPLIFDYWRRDPRVVWTVAPKPTMADGMYRTEFWDWPLEERFRRMHDFEFCITQNEVVFDAADVMRLGRDVLVQESMTTNRLGIHWLKHHLEPPGLRVHPVHFPLDFFPSHLDCTFVPLRPGLVLTNPDRPLERAEARLFLDNGWQLVDAPRPSVSNDEMPEFCQSSHWLSMNVLSLSPKTVVCESSEHALQELLDALGFEVLSLPFRHVYEFGGSLHCATWDVRRASLREDYFPKQSYSPLIGF